jgi:hypothetical protein
MKTCRGSEGIGPYVQVYGQLHSRRKEPQYPLDRSVSGPQSRSGRCGVHKTISCPCRESNPGRPPCRYTSGTNSKFRLMFSLPYRDEKLWGRQRINICVCTKSEHTKTCKASDINALADRGFSQRLLWRVLTFRRGTSSVATPKRRLTSTGLYRV